MQLFENVISSPKKLNITTKFGKRLGQQTTPLTQAQIGIMKPNQLYNSNQEDL